MNTKRRTDTVKKVKVYVFGHYDSRGGTVAIVVDKHEGQLEYAKREYEKVMGWSEEEGKHVNAGMGRVADNKVADMISPKGPADEDYLWPAEIEGLEQIEGWVEDKGIEGEEGTAVDVEEWGDWWVVTRAGMTSDEQIAKYGAVQLKVIEALNDNQSSVRADQSEWSKASVSVPAGDEGVVIVDELWCHPEWSDDAFSFLLVNLEKEKVQ